jgi:hypothetical protein
MRGDIGHRRYPEGVATPGEVIEQFHKIRVSNWQVAFLNAMEGEYPPASERTGQFRQSNHERARLALDRPGGKMVKIAEAWVISQLAPQLTPGAGGDEVASDNWRVRGPRGAAPDG